MRTTLLNIILLVITTTVLISCNDDENIQTFDFSGDWKVISFIDLKISEKTTKTEENTWSLLNNVDNTISFTKSDSTKGIVSGKNVTNGFYGEYTTDSNGKILITNVIWTKINEPEWGKLFHSISNAESYEIKNNILTIFYNNKMKCITLEKISNE